MTSSPPTSPSPPSLLRFHPRGPPPAIRPGVNSSSCQYNQASFAAAPTSPQRFLNAVPGQYQYQHQLSHSGARKSPRQLKLQKVEPFALRMTQVSATFHHELFQFHQALRDAVATVTTSQPQQQQSHQKPSGPYDCSVFELLTSDRGDAVLKELFRQWQAQVRKRSAALIADVEDEDYDSSEVLWDVLETFFKSVPLVLPESEVANAKSYFRYLDALKALRDVLLALLYKSDHDPKADSNGDEDDNESSLGLSLDFLTPPPSKSKPPTSSHRHLIPMHVHCQQLERELQKLRERHPSRSQVAGFRASLKRNERQDVGLLNDTTVLMLLDFWELPKTERLGFFCQIASQTNEEDAAMVLHVFLENCSTHNFLQVWDALQQSPQFEATFTVAARKYYEALMAQQSSVLAAEAGGGGDVTASTIDGPQQQKKSLKTNRKDMRRSTRSRQSLSIGRNSSGGGHRQSRFVDLNGLTEVFEERDDEFFDNSDSGSDRFGGVNGDGSDDSDDSGGSLRRKDGRRFQKIMIRERGRTPPEERHRSLNHQQRRRQRHHHRGPERKTPSRPVSPSGQAKLNPMQVQLPPVNLQASLIQRLHDDLVELIKQEELSNAPSKFGASPVVMDSVWKLLELLDKGKQPSTNSSSSNRHLRSDSVRQNPNGSASGLQPADSGPNSGPSRSNSVQPEHRQTLADPLGANLTRDQQFMIKFDQLQSLLTSLGSFSLHEMATDTISNVYRRMPAVARLFTGIHEKTYAAAGVDVPSAGSVSSRLNLSFDGVGHPHQQPQTAAHGMHGAGHRQSVMMAPVTSMASADDQVIEAAGALMAKVGKMVRSLVNLDQLSSGSSGKSSNLDVLAILKLADDMESDSGGGQDDSAKRTASSGKADVEQSRRASLLDQNRRLAILHKLRALAMSNELDAIAEMVSESVKDAHEQHVQQVQQIELLSSGSAAASGGKRRRHRRFEQVLDGDAGGGDDEDEDDEDVADEVLKMAKKAKTRRASAAKAYSQTTQDASVENGDDDDGDSDPPFVNTGRRDLLLNIKQASGQQKGVKLFSVGILLRIIYQVQLLRKMGGEK